MRALYCAAGLLVSFACANGQESRPSKIPRQTLAILFQFNQPYASRALLEAQRELEVLTKGTVKLEWHDRRGPQAGSSFPSILVLDFLGRCDPRSEDAFTGPMDGWLARMRVSAGIVLPFGEVNCDQVLALLRDGRRNGRPDDSVFGRALARVLAHELLHFITSSPEHLAQGFGKPSLSRDDLVLDGLKLDRYQLDLLSTTTLK